MLREIHAALPGNLNEKEQTSGYRSFPAANADNSHKRSAGWKNLPDCSNGRTEIEVPFLQSSLNKSVVYCRQYRGLVLMFFQYGTAKDPV